MLIIPIKDGFECSDVGKNIQKLFLGNTFSFISHKLKADSTDDGNVESNTNSREGLFDFLVGKESTSILVGSIKGFLHFVQVGVKGHVFLEANFSVLILVKDADKLASSGKSQGLVENRKLRKFLSTNVATSILVNTLEPALKLSFFRFG